MTIRNALGGLLAGLLAIAALGASLAAQDRPRIWLGAGLGSGARSDGGGGFGLMGEIVYQVRAHHLAIRAVGVVDPFSDNADEFGEIGALYGRVAKRKWGHASIAAGLAITAVSSCSDADTSGCTSIGVPLVAEAALRLGKVAGVGAQGFANFNTKAVYGGFVLFLQLGWLPE